MSPLSFADAVEKLSEVGIQKKKSTSSILSFFAKWLGQTPNAVFLFNKFVNLPKIDSRSPKED